MTRLFKRIERCSYELLVCCEESLGHRVQTPAGTCRCQSVALWKAWATPNSLASSQ
jgi:hypothetical protein